MISVGIERNVPIRWFATAIGLINAYISIHGQVSVERFQGYSFSGYFPSSLSILKPDSRRKWLNGKRCDICVFVDMPVYSNRYQPN